ncbi:MAG: T9SS type A sorting domain-containing protein [Bacteroidetes bacterium]|nr:T9SS type A sorting domain-containing protein [Bacteroidota bacterium]
MSKRLLIFLSLIVVATSAGAQTQHSRITMTVLGSPNQSANSICDISPDDSLYLYVRAMYCWKGVDNRKAMDTCRLYVERHPFATKLPGEVLGAIGNAMGFVSSLPRFSRADWIDSYNWLLKVQPLNLEPAYQYHIYQALANNLSELDLNEAANLWWNMTFMFPDTGDVSTFWRQIRSIRNFQAWIPQDTTPFHRLSFPLQPMPGGTSDGIAESEAAVSFSVYPNPVTDATTIHYEIPTTGTVSISVYDLLGNERKALISGLRDNGKYSIPLDRVGLAPGSYYVRLSYGNTVLTRKIIVGE